MPPPAVPYSPLPYVRNGSIGELIRLRGRNAADAELRRGELSQQMWNQLGQTIAGTVNQISQQRQDAPRLAQEAESRALALQSKRNEVEQQNRLTRQDGAFMALLEQQPNPDPKEVMSIYGPQRGMQIAQGLHAFGELQAGQVKDARDTAGRLAIGLTSLSPQLQQQMWPGVREAAIKGGLGDAESIPEQFTPEFAQAVIGWAKGEAPTAPSLIQRDPTRDLVHPQTGEVVSAGTPEPDKVTYGAPSTQMVNGKRALIRTGSDGKAYDMDGNHVAGTAIQPLPDDGPTPQYMWASDKDGSVRLMSTDEIRRTGAGQAPTADMRNKGSVKATAARAVGAVRKLGERVITKVGPAQRADAIKRGTEAVFGSDPEFRTYQDSRMALAGTLAVEQQGSRVSDADVKALWLPMVPDAYRDTSESQALKWELIDTMRGVDAGGGAANDDDGWITVNGIRVRERR